MTEDQLELLRDKYVLWDAAARHGPEELRDYNRRAAEALKEALTIVSDVGVDPEAPRSSYKCATCEDGYLAPDGMSQAGTCPACGGDCIPF
jgi:PHP family Zn ribbon phosphoesterase